MANEIRLKRRASTGSVGAPSSLKNAEPAFNEADKVLYLGFGDDGSGGATSVISIGGEGAFATLGTTQTISGDKTYTGVLDFQGDVTAVTQVAGNSTTKIATTAFVGGEISNLSQTISVSGDTGTGSADLKNDTVVIAGGTGLSSVWNDTAKSITLELDDTAVTATSYGAADKVGTFTVDAQGRITAASDTDIDITHDQVSDFDTGVQSNTLNSLTNPDGNVALNSFRIIDLANPVSDSDAANKRYVDNVATGLDVKSSVRAATTQSILSLNGNPGAQDGVTLADGDRLLVKDQSNASENGIYIYDSTPGNAWVRADDFDSSDNVTGGAFVFVEEGTTQGDNGYVVTSDGTINVGTDDINFEQFSGAGQIIAGAGIAKNGNELSVDIKAGGGIIFSNTQLKVNLSASQMAGFLKVSDGGTGVETLTGLVKADGTNPFAAAVDGTDYLSPNAEIDGGTF